jgi:hypothetical protein
MLETSLQVLLAVPEPTQSTDLASLLHEGAGAENMISCSTGSLKQLLPESSNLRHLASARLLKANATCLETLRMVLFEVLFPRQACIN